MLQTKFPFTNINIIIYITLPVTTLCSIIGSSNIIIIIIIIGIFILIFIRVNFLSSYDNDAIFISSCIVCKYCHIVFASHFLCPEWAAARQTGSKSSFLSWFHPLCRKRAAAPWHTGAFPFISFIIVMNQHLPQHPHPHHHHHHHHFFLAPHDHPHPPLDVFFFLRSFLDRGSLCFILVGIFGYVR